MTTAMEAALRRAEVPVERSRLYVLAAETLRAAPSARFAAKVLSAAISDDPRLLVELVGVTRLDAICLEYVSAIQRDMNSSSPVHDGDAHIVAARGEGGGGLIRSDNQSARAAATSPIPRIAGLSARRETALTVLDSLKVRDGRSIGDVRWTEIPRLEGENTREATVLRLIRKRFARVDNEFATVRDLITPRTLERIIQEAAHAQDTV